MKHTNKAFTLLESLIVLGVLSSMLWVGCTKIPQTEHINQWEATFKSQWQHARLTAQQEQKTQVVHFEAQTISFGREIIKYPSGYQNASPKSIRILKTGYVAPITITLTSNQKTLKLIFNLGGGDYRIEKT
ncbi:type II secretion protein [Leuconostoc rapi]|uniref:type II secretion protein n=1 Tax=Leuconostoc rapi TaxID=1406906 RepID=UPI0019579AA0|nr:type II secretion protein [Leuconostoc rapi]MBM7436244.1 competence protein ComGD [Leuconostoc rapi]